MMKWWGCVMWARLATDNTDKGTVSEKDREGAGTALRWD